MKILFILVFMIPMIMLGDEQNELDQIKEDLRSVLMENAEKIMANNLNILPYETFNNLNVSLDVIPQKSSRSAVDNFKTSYGSYDKDILSTKAMKVVVRKSGEFPYAAVEFFWSIRDEENKSMRLERCEPVLLTREKREAEFSRTSERSDTKYVYLGTRDKDGEKVAGWLARCVALLDGKVIGVKASNQELEKLGKKGSSLGSSD